MDKFQLVVGRLMLAAILLSFVVVLIGGVLYLFSHGGDEVHYHVFHAEPVTFKSVSAVVKYGFSSSLGLIQLGLFILVLIQLMRVALTVVYFMKLRELFFTIISLFIFSVLAYSLFWRF